MPYFVLRVNYLGIIFSALWIDNGVMDLKFYKIININSLIGFITGLGMVGCIKNISLIYLGEELLLVIRQFIIPIWEIYKHMIGI